MHSIFLLISPEERPEEHIDAMEAIFGNLSRDQFRRFLKQRESREQYDRLFDQATDAQIPVLNWNRFEMLTGMNPR